MINIASNLVRSAALFPERTALSCAGQSTSYAQLDAASSALAHGLRSLGIGKGDKVALSCPNLAWFPIAYYAILKLGAVAVPLNILLKAAEIAYHLRDSDARVFLCFQDSAELPMAEEGWQAFTQVDACEHFFLIEADPARPAKAADPGTGTATLCQLMRDQPEHIETAATAAVDSRSETE